MITKKTIDMLEGAMSMGERDNGKSYFYFNDTVDETLQDLFRKNYSLRDLDYEIFNRAIDTICEAFHDCKNKKDLQEYIRDNYTEYASIMTYDRLQYLNNNNDDEIARNLREWELATVSQACAVWYDEQVQCAIEKILDLYE